MKRGELMEEIRQRLISRRERLRAMLAGELSQMGSDDDEESLDDEAYVQTAVTEGKELEMILEALKRFREGTYGICEDCESEIPAPRLEALPCAMLCIECQRKAETHMTHDREEERDYDLSD